MKKLKYLKDPHARVTVLVILLLILPAVFRSVWFNKGAGIFQHYTKSVAFPEYSKLEIVRPELSSLPKSNDPVITSNAEVLFDISHGNLYDLSELETLTNLINHRGGHINVTDYYNNFESELKKVDAFVVIAPTLPYEEAERQAVARFVERGGRLLVIADPTRSAMDFFLSLEETMGSLGNTEITNLLLEPFGIAYSKGYVYNLAKNEGNFRNVYFSIIYEDPISDGLSKVVFYGLHSIKSAPRPLIVGDGNTLSSLTDRGSGLIAAASAAEGRVLALTDLNFMIPPYHRVADNAILIDNIAEFLSGTLRERTLADFPYLFTRPVTLMIDGEKALNSGMLSTITGAQQSMERLGLELNISNEPEKDHDLVAFGLFPPDEALEPLLAPFGLDFSGIAEDTETEEEMEAVEEAPALEVPITSEELLALDGAEIEALLESLDEANAQALMESLSEAEIEALMEKMQDVEMEETDKGSGSTMDVPGFGKVETDGIGLILYNDTGEQNTVILLADTQDNLQTLASAFYNGIMDNCAIQGQIAVCLLGEESDDFYWEGDYGDHSEPDYSDEYDAAG